MKFLAFILFLFAFSFCDELNDLTKKGISAFKKNNYEKALEYFNEAAQKYPMSSEAKFNKGLALGASGNVKEAEAVLSGVKFEKADKNAEVLYTRARIAEAVGDALAQNEQQPNFSQAKKAYQTARSLYAQSLDFKKNKKAVNNVEILSQKIKNIPEQEDHEQEDQDNKDDQQNQDNKDDKGDDKNDDKNQQEQEQDQEQNDQNDENQDEEQNRQEQKEEDVQDAMRLLEHYADDAKELNKPPLQKAVPPANGKDW